MPLEMESGYFSPIPRIEKYAGNPMKRVLHFQGKVIGITGIFGQKVIRIALVYPTGLKFHVFLTKPERKADSNVKGYILGLFSCAAIVTIVAMTLTENKKTDLTQIQAVMEENKSDIYIDGYSFKIGDVYVNHRKLYIKKGE